ncbi:anti-sigma factor family protein [Spirochaeta cellobiosiphila]|uniref:anti-sigma factor family protein n=1 Tax=Spirochaeta cellobiosiphila TaxID=504483 RepID=UPI00040D336A|nr:zf-HC2 domain-containing protein [Spirochaeta cellobiosiphila]
MCPDKTLLSAYLDNEVPTPWDHQIKEHIDSCPECKQEYLSLKNLKVLMSEDNEALTMKEPDMDRFNDIVRSSPKRGMFWHKSINIPAPLVTVAAAALFALGGINFWNGMNSSAQNSGDLLNNLSMNANVQDVDLALELMEAEQGLNSKNTMEIPTDMPIKTYGNPEFLRSASFKGNSGK